jgi:hypothetical protein
MDFKIIKLQKIILIFFVLAISMMVGWSGERAAEKFIADYKIQSF